MMPSKNPFGTFLSPLTSTGRISQRGWPKRDAGGRPRPATSPLPSKEVL